MLYYFRSFHTARYLAFQMTRRITRQEKWEALVANDESNPKETGVSSWKTIQEITDVGLPWGKNGNQRHGKFFGLTKYMWEAQRVKRSVVAIRTTGFDKNVEEANLLKNRPIAKRIYQHFKGVPCVACGSTKSLVVDHKNDLYNDPRVHDPKTQEIDDFQSLCNACNLAKRADCSKTKKNGVRQPAPHMCKMMGGPDFIEGDETFDPNGLGLKGTFWYDVEAYFNYCRVVSRK